MKNKLKKLNPRRKKQGLGASGKITNENLAEHREQVIGNARKYIYPLRHSKHRLVKISVTILVISVIGFFTYCVLALYKFKTTSDFMYQVTKVVPFPLARIGSDFVSYESYLFEVKHYTHYYHYQQDVDFDSDAGKAQLDGFKKRAREKVINDAYVKEIAQEKGISVSEQEVNDQISIYKNQNRLGASEEEFKTVLRNFWDWSIDDFKTTLRQQILNEKVITALDTEANQKAEAALNELKAGADFAKLAKQKSEDPATSSNGGDFGFDIDQNNRDISPNTVNALFNLKPGDFSGIVNIGYGLEIVKNIEQKNNKIRAAHIVFNFKDINEYLGPIKDQRKTRSYVVFD